MATRNHQPDVSVLEYDRLMDAVKTRLDDGTRYFHTECLATAADLTDAQVYEAMSHLAAKHDYITDAGNGRWRVAPDTEV